MKKLAILVAILLFFGGCINSPKYQKVEIPQSKTEIAYYENLLKNKTPNEVAKLAVEDVAKKNGGANRRTRIDQFLIFEKIYSQDENVIFNYSLTQTFIELPQKDRLKFAEFMQVDLVNRVCNLKTARNTLKHGTSEIRKYFYDYPSNLAFELKVDEEICQKAGL